MVLVARGEPAAARFLHWGSRRSVRAARQAEWLAVASAPTSPERGRDKRIAGKGVATPHMPRAKSGGGRGYGAEVWHGDWRTPPAPCCGSARGFTPADAAALRPACAQVARRTSSCSSPRSGRSLQCAAPMRRSRSANWQGRLRETGWCGEAMCLKGTKSNWRDRPAGRVADR